MAFHSEPIEFSSKSFENINVATSKKYLQKRRITTNHYKKEILVKLTKCAKKVEFTSGVNDLRRKLEEIQMEFKHPTHC